MLLRKSSIIRIFWVIQRVTSKPAQLSSFREGMRQFVGLKKSPHSGRQKVTG